MNKVSSSTASHQLDSLKNKLNIKLRSTLEIEQWRDRLQEILSRQPFSKDPYTSSHRPKVFQNEARALSEEFHRPKDVHISALRTLRPEMRRLLEEKEKQLSFMIECEQMLDLIPDGYKNSFLQSFQDLYHNAVKEMIPPEDSFIKALGFVLSRSLIDPKTIEDEKLQRYTCPIRREVIDSQDAVFLRTDSKGQPRERYHPTDLKKWLRDRRTDPITNLPRRVASIKTDPKSRSEVQTVLRPLLYPQAGSSSSVGVSGHVDISNIPFTSIFLAARVGYSIARTIYEQAIQQGMPYNEAAIEAEKALFFAIKLLDPLLKAVPQEALQFFTWQQTLTREPSYQNAQPDLLYYIDSQEKTPKKTDETHWRDRICFMQEFIKAHHTSDQTSDELRPVLEDRMDQYLEYLQNHTYDIPSTRETVLQKIVRGEVKKTHSREEEEGKSSKRPKIEPLSDFEIRMNCLEGFF